MKEKKQIKIIIIDWGILGQILADDLDFFYLSLRVYDSMYHMLPNTIKVAAYHPQLHESIRFFPTM